MLKLGLHIATLIFLLTWGGCKRNELTTKNKEYTLSYDSLRVGVCASPTAWGYTSNTMAGYDYELLQRFAESQGMNIILNVLPASQAVAALQEDVIDLLAYPCPITKEVKNKLLFVPMQDASPIVLVQLDEQKALSNTAQLNHQKVMVHRNSMEHLQLKRLNREIGGDMRIGLVHDTVNTDCLMEGIVNNKWQYVALPQYKAKAYQRIYPQLNISMRVSAPRTTGWVMKDHGLQQALLSWKENNAATLARLQQRYMNGGALLSHLLPQHQGAISPFDAYFKEFAPSIHWDWQLLAALCYHESRFNPLTISPAGACGLMQLMPITARRFGLNDTTMFHPRENIRAGVEYVKYLNMIYHEIEDPSERVKFILASYNAGPAHVLDAMRLADKYGKNPRIWYDNVEFFLLQKNQPEYYNDPEVRFGKFNGRPTCAYVKNVLNTYHTWRR